MEIDYGALFGIDAGGNEQEAAEPAQEETTQAQGAEAQEAAEPAGEETQEPAPGQEPGEGGKERRERQTPEQNAAFAAARRKAEAERDAAVEKARTDAREEARRTIDEAFRNSGLVNPYTKQPITSKAEYDAYRQRYDAERKASLLKKSGMSDAEFSAFIDGLPEVQQAKAAQRAAEQARRAAMETQAKLRTEEELKEIGKLDPNIRELKDLTAMETYPRFLELVRRGNTLLDAYRLANLDALTSGAAAATRQAAINAVQSKRHMGQTKERGSGALRVPEDVRAMYRALNPGATDAEIQAHYNRSHKKD